MEELNFFAVLMLFSVHINLIQSALFFPSNSAYGLFAAIAVPLDLPHRNVFVSYNFEANYNLPKEPTLPAHKLTEEAKGQRLIESNEFPKTTTVSDMEGNTTRVERSLLSRVNFYEIVEDKLKRSGYSGELCMLRLICETNESSIGEINGLLGNIFHIIFTPSSSMEENLPLKYYKAELDGVNGNCEKYGTQCKHNVLDLVSTPLQVLLNSMQR